MGQVLSLQPKSFPCRASLQESETWCTSLGLRFVRDSTQRMGLTFFWPMDMDPLGSPSLISYFILFRYLQAQPLMKLQPQTLRSHHYLFLLFFSVSLAFSLCIFAYCCFCIFSFSTFFSFVVSTVFSFEL